MDKKYRPERLTCSCCGKQIRKGSKIYRIPGIIYKCCSAECLLSAYTNYYTEESTGYDEED